MLDTLAQSGTVPFPKTNTKNIKTLTGKGSDLSDKVALNNRAKRKMISQSLVLPLIDIAKKAGNQKLINTLWNAYHCQNSITTGDGRLHTRYCRTRICNVCNGIRKAEKIRRVITVIQTWERPVFVTLTAKSVPAKSLPRRMKDMIRGLKILLRRYKKRALRGKGQKFEGIRSLECNFNPTRRTYNPHLHLIVRNQEMADQLISDWLILCKGYASIKGQHSSTVKADEIVKNLVEVIKYSTKQFTSPDPNNKRKKQPKYVYTKALYNIISSMQGLRLFDRFGFNLPKETRPRGTNREVINVEQWKYNKNTNDWHNTKGQRLTGFLPSLELIVLITDKINTDLE